MKKGLVTIVIPGWNSGKRLPACLESIKNQSYNSIEVLIIDNFSKDETKTVAKKYKAKVYDYDPKLPKGVFDATYRRNYGAKKASGEYVYYLDDDMRLTQDVVKEAVEQCKKGADAVILPEESFGEGIWAEAKWLERRCYQGDDTVEAPRFFKKAVWDALGGLDTTVGGGGDDWDMYQKLLQKGYKVARTKSLVMHDEGNLELYKLLRKRFMYGRDSLRYIKKRPGVATQSYFPIRMAYIRNWKFLLSHPIITTRFIIMRTGEYGAGALGILYSFIKKHD